MYVRYEIRTRTFEGLGRGGVEEYSTFSQSGNWNKGR